MIRANHTNGNMPSTLGDAIVVGIGSKFIKRTIYITPAEKAHPYSNINRLVFSLKTKTADNKIIKII